MSNPAISVVVPMYKVERYIKICIDSILGQTFKDFEIVIVDDASPDNCYEICQKLYGTNAKVRIVRHAQNKGLGPARNTGIENARGKYIYFVDSDDAITVDALQILYDAAQKTDADVIHIACYYETTQDDDKAIDIKKLKLLYKKYNNEGFLKYDIPYRLREHWINSQSYVMAWLNMYNREFIKKNNLKFLDVISEDEVYTVDTYLAAEKFYILPKAIYIYRKRQNSIMNKYDEKRFSNGVKAMLKGAAHIKEKLEFTPAVAYDKKLLDEMIGAFFFRNNSNHILPFYGDPKLQPELDKIVFNEFLPVFKENTMLVKNLFNLTNIFATRSMVLANQTNMLIQQNKQLQTMNAILQEKSTMLNLIDEMRRYDKKFLFMLSPTHGNIGDQAIVLGEYKVMQTAFPDYKIIDIPYDYMVGQLGEIFSGLGYQKYITPNDAIVLHGGGNLGNLYINEEIPRRAVIQKFPDNRIVIFPQSIYFSDDAEGQKQAAISANIYNAHKDLHLMLRDENSFNVAQKLFPNVNKYLLPDIVTSLFGDFDKFNVQRQGVLFVLRKDKEKVINDSAIKTIQNFLAQNKVPYEVMDTVIDERVTFQTRFQKFSEVLLKFRKSKLVITDRFHGVIFSIISKTPILAFKSYDTKITSGIKWFKEFPSVFYAQDKSLEEILKFIVDAYNGAFTQSLSTPPPPRYGLEWLQSGTVKRFFEYNKAIPTPPRVESDTKIND